MRAPLGGGFAVWWISVALWIFSVGTFITVRTIARAAAIVERSAYVTDRGGCCCVMQTDLPINLAVQGGGFTFGVWTAAAPGAAGKYQDFSWNEDLKKSFAYHFFHLLWNVELLIYFVYMVRAAACMHARCVCAVRATARCVCVVLAWCEQHGCECVHVSLVVLAARALCVCSACVHRLWWQPAARCVCACIACGAGSMHTACVRQATRDCVQLCAPAQLTFPSHHMHFHARNAYITHARCQGARWAGRLFLLLFC